MKSLLRTVAARALAAALTFGLWATATLAPARPLLAQSSPIRGLSLDSAPADTDALPVQKLGDTRAKYQTRAQLRSGLATAPTWATYNVRFAPYSAAGNGSTDDTTAIQSAINDACTAAAGGEVYLPLGVYKVSSTLSVTCAGVSLRGDGPGTTILRTASTTADILAFGNTTTAYSPCGGVRNLTLSSSVTRTAGAALTIDGCEQGEAASLRIATTGGDGIHISPTGHLATIWFFRSIDVEISGAFTAISITGGNDRYFTDLWLRGNSTAGSRGLSLTSSAGDWFTNVEAVLFEDGVLMAPGNGQSVLWASFQNVLGDTNTLYGWRFQTSGTGVLSGVSCTNCWASTNGITSASARGFSISAGNGVNLIAPRVFNNGGHGIEISGGTNVRVSSAMIAGNGQQASNTFDGVNVNSSAADFRIAGSSIGNVAGQNGTQRYGVNIAAGSDTYQVVGNDFAGNLTGDMLNTPGLSPSRIVSGNLGAAIIADSYIVAGGVSGGQTLSGGTAASDNLTVHSTSNATRGKILLGTSAYDEANNRLGIGWASPDTPLAVSANAAALPVPTTGTLAHLGGTDATAARIGIDGFGTGGLPGITFRRSLGTAASRSALGSANTFGSLYWQGAYDATNFSGDVAQVGCETAEAFTSTAQGTNCFVSTTHTGGTTLERRYALDSAGHWLWATSTTSPTVACTGTGTSPAAPTIAGVDSAFTITVNTGIGVPGSSGTCTVTFGTAFVTNMPVLVCTLQNGATAWGVGSGVMVTTKSLSAPILTWWNETAGVLATLATSTSYQINCRVDGKGN